MNIKRIILMCMFIFLIGIVSASAPSLGTFRLNDDIELKQTCVINGTFCDSCNISSIDYPNGTIAISNVQMTKRVGDFNYTLNDTYTDITGTYRVSGFCDYGSDVRKIWVYVFEITPTGGELSTGRAITYIVALIIGLIIFLGLLLMGLYLPSGNKKDEMTGYILAVSNLKYLKYVFLGLAYLTALVIAYFAYTLSYAYLEFNFITNLFRILFYAEAIAVLPLFILFTYLTITNLVRDTKVKDSLMRGLRVR